MDIPEESFELLKAELIRKKIPINRDRWVAGEGRSQAFGVIRRWAYRPHLSRNTWMRPTLWGLLMDFAAKHVSIQWDAVTVNDNYVSAPHKDKGNEGESFTVSFGDFTGGELCMEGPSGETISVETRHRGVLFNGSEVVHWTAPFEGRRFCLVFYKLSWPSRWERYQILCAVVEDGLLVKDEYDQSIVVLDVKGHVVRTIQKGVWREWIGRLSSRSEPARAALPIAEETSNQEFPSLGTA